MRLVLATANAHKLREIADLLRDIPNLKLLSLHDFPDLELPEETGTTMQENARLKAKYCHGATGLSALADDSGIEVDALQGAPGVLSARWVPGSDADRTQALLDKLREVPPEQRTARYRCVIYLAHGALEGVQHAVPLSVSSVADTQLIEAEATCEGRITNAPRGSNGFGYDPIFEITPATDAPPEWIGSTLAEAPPEIKAQVSHRARALAAIKPQLRVLAEALNNFD